MRPEHRGTRLSVIPLSGQVSATVSSTTRLPADEIVSQFLQDSSLSVPTPITRSLSSIARESDAELAYSDILHLLREMNQSGRSDLSQTLGTLCTQHLQEASGLSEGLRENFRSQLNEELALARGEGPWQRRGEIYFSQFIDQVADPVLLASFATGAVGFNLGRWGTLGWLTRSGAVSSAIGRGGIRAATFLAGVGSESLAFTLTQRGLHNFTHPNFSMYRHPFGQEFLATAMSFGLFRAAGRLSEGMLRWHHGVPAYLPPTSFARGRLSERLLTAVVPNATTYGALLLSHDLQVRIGLSQPVPLDAMMLGSLGSLLHLKAAGHLFHQIQPRSLQLWSHQVESEANWVLNAPRVYKNLLNPRNSRRLPPLGGPGLGWMPATAGMPGYFTRNPRPLAENVLMASSEGPRERFLESEPPPSYGKTDPSRPIVNRELTEVLEAAPWPVMILNRHGIILSLNSHLRGLWQNSPEVLEGRPFSDLMEIISGSHGHYRFRFDQSGDQIYQLQFNPVEDREYQVVYLRPQTGPRLVPEAEEHPLAARLRVMEGMNNYLGGVVHDMSNYMFSLTSFMEMHYPRLMQTFEQTYGRNAQYKMMAEHGQAVTESLDSIIGQIRLFRDLMRGLSPEKTLFSLRDLAQLSLRHYLPEASQLGLNLRIREEAESPFILGNPEILSTAMVNLMRNSGQASSAGQDIEILVQTRGDRGVLTVRDFGSGIRPEHLEHVFEPKFTTKTKGTGLGLFMVKTIVEDILDGNIQVQSQLGKGTSIILDFPLADPLDTRSYIRSSRHH